MVIQYSFNLKFWIYLLLINTQYVIIVEMFKSFKLVNHF